MSKYTGEEIIAYLKTLREGDTLTAVMKGRWYTAGKTYQVEADSDGDLRVKDDEDCDSYVNIGDEYDCSFANDVQCGIFDIPSTKPFKLGIAQTIDSGQYGVNTYYHVSVTVDEAGLAKLRELEAESLKTSELSQLYAERVEIQRKIDGLEASSNGE